MNQNVRRSQTTKIFPDTVSLFLRRVGKKLFHLDRRVVPLDEVLRTLSGAKLSNTDVTVKEIGGCYVEDGTGRARAVRLIVTSLNDEGTQMVDTTVRITTAEWHNFCKDATFAPPIHRELGQFDVHPAVAAGAGAVPQRRIAFA